jgi:hypothetical protein
LETDEFRDLAVTKLEKQYEKAVVDNTVTISVKVVVAVQ